MLKTKSLSWAYGGVLCVFFSNHPPSSKGKKLHFFSLPTLVFPQLTQLRASLHGDWDDTDFCIWWGSWDRRCLTFLEGQYSWTLSGLFKVFIFCGHKAVRAPIANTTFAVHRMTLPYGVGHNKGGQNNLPSKPSHFWEWRVALLITTPGQEEWTRAVPS